jgi:hypothetical protein
MDITKNAGKISILDLTQDQLKGIREALVHIMQEHELSLAQEQVLENIANSMTDIVLPPDLIGNEYVVVGLADLGDNEIKHCFGEENLSRIKSCDGKKAKVLSIETSCDENSIPHTYFNVVFEDGFEIQGLSGYHFVDFREEDKWEKT